MNDDLILIEKVESVCRMTECNLDENLEYFKIILKNLILVSNMVKSVKLRLVTYNFNW